MSWLLWSALAVARPALPEATWIDGVDGRICVSSVPDGPRMRGKDAKALASILSALSEAEDAGALLAAQADAVDGWKPHPAKEALLAGVRASLGDGDDALSLAEGWPYDGCLQATAGRVLLSRGDAEAAQTAAGRAWIRTKHPEAALVLAEAALALEGPDRAGEVVDKGLAVAPEHPGLRGLRASLFVRRGRAAEVVDDLRWLRAQGDATHDEALMLALLQVGDLDGYLRLAVERGAPLGGLDLEGAASPLVALRDFLGQEGAAGVQVVLRTSLGDIPCTLFPDRAPVTVASFVGLAAGTQPWVDPRTGAPGEGPLYDGTLFHRVIPGFMIQGGDPLGTGAGGPGYDFHDEVWDDLGFDRPGRLAMANSGPGTNGSQFFVTLEPVPHLDGRHTIFGQCEAREVVGAIAVTPRDRQDRPRQDVVLESVEVRSAGGLAPRRGAAPEGGEVPAGG